MVEARISSIKWGFQVRCLNGVAQPQSSCNAILWRYVEMLVACLQETRALACRASR